MRRQLYAWIVGVFARKYMKLMDSTETRYKYRPAKNHQCGWVEGDILYCAGDDFIYGID